MINNKQSGQLEAIRKRWADRQKCPVSSKRLDGDGDVEWITVKGTHIPLKDGKAVGGPDGVKKEINGSGGSGDGAKYKEMEYTQETYKSGEWDRNAKNAVPKDYSSLGEYSVEKSGKKTYIARNPEGFAICSAFDPDELKKSAEKKISELGQTIGMKSGQKRTFSTEKMTKEQMKYALSIAATGSVLISKDGKRVYTRTKDGAWTYRQGGDPKAHSSTWNREVKTNLVENSGPGSFSQMTLIKK